VGRPDKEVTLETLVKHIPYDKGTLFVVQRERSEEAIHQLTQMTPLKVMDGAWSTKNLADLSALLYSLDDYITVSNTNVYIRTGFGKTCTLLDTPTTDFRMNTDEEGNPVWFPGCKLIPF